MMEVKNIIFDFGGVLLPIEYDATPRAFRELGVTDFQLLYSQTAQSGLFDRYEKGKISEAGFLNELKGIIGNYSDEKIVQCWNAMLGAMSLEVLSFLNQCRNHYKIYLLSNTNFTHITAFKSGFRKQFPKTDFHALFEKVYYSFEIGLRKPDRDIFDFVFADAGLKKHETIFIEDTLQNVEGARKAGVPSIYLDIKSGMKTVGLFDTAGVLKQGSLEIVE